MNEGRSGAARRAHEERSLSRGRQRLVRLLRDERGQDLVEYALLTGIIAIAGALVFPPLKDRMANAYQAWNANAQAISTPPPPM